MEDIRVIREGNLFMFNPLTLAGENWLRDNTDGMWYDGCLVVEHRYAVDVADGAIKDGLEVV